MPQIEHDGSVPPGASELMVTAIRPAAVMDRGEGSWLWDTDGRRYWLFRRVRDGAGDWFLHGLFA